MSNYKVGDLVYCPSYTTELCTLSLSNGKYFAVKGNHSLHLFDYIDANGRMLGAIGLMHIIRATEQNRLALNALHNAEFEKNTCIQ